jgi:hypothetical protein
MNDPQQISQFKEIYSKSPEFRTGKITSFSLGSKSKAKSSHPLKRTPELPESTPVDGSDQPGNQCPGG